MPVQPNPVTGLALVDSPDIVLPAPFPTIVSSGGVLALIPSGSSTPGGLVPLATPSANGLMSAAQAAALAGLQPSKTGGAFQSFYSDIIDLTAVATYVLLPPTPARIILFSAAWEIKATNTASVSPTYSMGTNSSSFNNVAASQTTAGIHTAVAEGLAFVGSTVNAAVDLTGSGLILNITGGATATALTARIYGLYNLVPV